MARYELQCNDCKVIYRASVPSPKNNIWSSYNKKGVEKVKCTKCGSTKKIIKSSSGGGFTIGGITDSKMENFDYRANVNMEKAKGERRTAEALTKDANPYGNEYYDTSNLDEGIHDNDEGIVL